MKDAIEIRDWTVHRCAEAKILHQVLSKEIEQLSQDTPTPPSSASERTPFERESPLSEAQTNAQQLALVVDTFNYVLEFIDS